MSEQDKIDKLLAKVDEQKEDEGLWFLPHTRPEVEIQIKLNELHHLIETKDYQALAKISREYISEKKHPIKSLYWQTAPEAYIERALMELHRLIEDLFKGDV